MTFYQKWHYIEWRKGSTPLYLTRTNLSRGKRGRAARTKRPSGCVVCGSPLQLEWGVCIELIRGCVENGINKTSNEPYTTVSCRFTIARMGKTFWMITTSEHWLHGQKNLFTRIYRNSLLTTSKIFIHHDVWKKLSLKRTSPIGQRCAL